MDELHGYTMADIDRLADRVVAAGRKWLADSDSADAHDRAWEGIATRLCEAAVPPTEMELREAGWRSLRHELRESRALIGMTMDEGAEGYSQSFEAYWSSHAMPTRFEDVLVDTLAFQQAWPALRTYTRDTFEAYAAAGYNKARAAQRLGITRQAMHKRIALGYVEFAGLWYGDEPVPPRGDDRDTGWERPDQRDPNRPNSIQNLRREAA